MNARSFDLHPPSRRRAPVPRRQPLALAIAATLASSFVVTAQAQPDELPVEAAGAGHARDTAVEGGADAVGEPMGDKPVDGVALGDHRPAFGGRDLRGELA